MIDMALTHLLDTSVYSQPIKKKPLKTVITNWESIGDQNLCISIFCETEILQGLEMKKSDKLWNAYNSILKDSLPIIYFTMETAKVYVKIQASCVRTGRTRPVFDLLIASTAIANNLILATCNYKDFKDIPGLKVENWLISL
ncbi:MAG: type II toxin-antitoxin system VapC family toxin [Spirochaetia bacterium]|jgi:tRNA(fMet)-specific endonuclease VapC|nr:type II toxin-antitoxin system VapC family toxin [Spirochaetia bacterium]